MKQTEGGAKILTKKEAKTLVMVRNEDTVHTFMNAPFGLFGADHSKQSIYEDIDKAVELQLAGESAQKMGHALAIFAVLPIQHKDILFVETNPEEVEKLNKKVKRK